MFDILITVAPKDYNKLPFVMKSVVRHIKGYNDLFVISPSPVPEEYKIIRAIYLSDDDVNGFDLSGIDKNRVGWYRQQFIKLFQDATIDDYLVIDADIWINKEFKINTVKPEFYLGKDQNHQPYFKLMKALLDVDKVYSHSFICEMMYFKRDMIWEMLKQSKRSKTAFLKACVEEIIKNGNPSGFSEYETYGNFVTKHYPELYDYKKINVLHGKRLRLWATQELDEYINKNSKSDYDILTMHSYI